MILKLAVVYFYIVPGKLLRSSYRVACNIMHSYMVAHTHTVIVTHLSSQIQLHLHKLGSETLFWSEESMSLGMKEGRSIVHSQSCMKIVYGPGMRIEEH